MVEVARGHRTAGVPELREIEIFSMRWQCKPGHSGKAAAVVESIVLTCENAVMEIVTHVYEESLAGRHQYPCTSGLDICPVTLKGGQLTIDRVTRRVVFYDVLVNTDEGLAIQVFTFGASGQRLAKTIGQGHDRSGTLPTG
jgi:hypothetical protein